MKRTLLPLNALRVFDAAARHLNFTRAADELAVTPAAVGQQIRAMEDLLGVVLFRRTPKGLELTPEATRPIGSERRCCWFTRTASCRLACCRLPRLQALPGLPSKAEPSVLMTR